MSKAGGKRKSVEPTDYENGMEPNVHESERNENIRLWVQKMQELNIQATAQQLSSMHQTNKNKKVCIPMNLKYMFSNNSMKCLLKSELIVSPNVDPNSC
jgi:hypothetical protein